MKDDMERLIAITARLIRAGARAYERKWSFLAVAILVFALLIYVLGSLGLLPDPPKADASPTVSLSESPLVAAAALATSTPPGAEEPVKIEIPAISLAATIADPASTDPAVLDNLLLSGAVRYPTSAKLNENGNVVLFGHSSYLPIVRNQAYKTFDGIQKLHAGDIIIVYSSHQVYEYPVRSVAKESADSGVIPLSVSGRVLTLSTCNSFATKSDRFVVTADFVGSHAHSS